MYEENQFIKNSISKLALLIVMITIPMFSFSTHIVGGSLTYVHNGGSSYTITLKLYRDCGAGTAGFPSSVNISVQGNNGADFSPSKDISMNLGSVTNVPSSLDPCADPPNPLPCVQEGIYTKTVNNLPPNPGGYHLYYQIIARNLSILNVNTSCNCIGESFYAYIPGSSPLWAEDFTLPNNTTVDNGTTAWNIVNGSPAPSSADVNNNVFEFNGADNGVATWASEIINIAAYPTGVNLSVDLEEQGNLENSDSIVVYYQLDGGAPTLFGSNGIITNDFGGAVASQGGVAGTTVQIFVRVHYGGNSPSNERYYIDNVSVFGNGTNNITNPEFNLFPPLFLCVNQPFTFDHSATDQDGDSLYYSFYTPYDGDNGNGPLDPTFPGNVATFTPVIWQPGFSATNPLGGTPLNLNSSTGILSGTPTMLGQFVVGIKVTEYRDGVYISETLRDFQMNVVPCPQPNLPVAGPDLVINDGCSDTITASGFIESTVSWNSVYPGTSGQYNNYLSCTSGCLNPIVTSIGTPPSYIDYVICGTAASCNNASVCDTVRVTFNPTLGVSIVPQDPTICFGQTSTTITANGTGGTPPYTYLWNNVNPSQTNIVGAGTYTVMCSDTSGCPPVYATVTVTAYANPITANAGVDDTVCVQNPVVTLNGSVVGASGGVWSGGNGTFSPDNMTLTGCNYIPTSAELNNGFVELILTTTGNGNCPPGNDTVRIDFIGFIGTISNITTNVSCFGGSDGTATINITGGIPSFTYTWNTVPIQTGAMATNLVPGTYAVVIENGIGCTVQDSVVITEPMPLAINLTINDVSCFEGGDGTISASAVGGTSPYSFSWLPGGQTGAILTGQTAGAYTVTVTDTNGCVLSSTDSISEPLPISTNISVTNVSCFGGNDGAAGVVVTGGTPPYTYNWSPSGGSSPNASGLTAGIYLLTVTDAKNCLKQDTITITEPLLPISGIMSVTDVSCFGGNDGSATVTANGGTPGYTYLWTPGTQTTSTVSGQVAGNYSVTITDTNGCESTVFATINNPPVLNVTTSQIDVLCFGGSSGVANSTSTGGTPGYSYLWMPGGMTTNTVSGLTAGSYNVLVTDTNGCQAQDTVIIAEPLLPVTVTATPVATSCNGGGDGMVSAAGSGGTPGYSYSWLPGGQTGASISGQSAGTYTVTVTDSNGCIATNSAVVTEPLPITIAFTPSDVSCYGGNNGSVSASVTGGTGPYTYSWSPSGGISSTASGLSAGTYVLTVTDSNNCIKTDSVVIAEPLLPVSGSTAITHVSCNGGNDGTVTVTASGGTPGYTYLWTPGGQTGSTISGQSAGTYTVTITDTNGCTSVKNAVINEPTQPAITFTGQTNVSCNGGNDGSISAVGSGGTPNFNYNWSPSGGTTSTASGLSAGTHVLTITDTKGCTAQDSVIITEPVVLTVTATPIATSCNGGGDGMVSAAGSGGTPGYSYSWLPGGQTGVSISGQSAGTYTVTVTDSNGCIATNSAVVTEPLPITIAFTPSDVSCYGGNNGSVSASVTGGTGPYTYSWSPSGGISSTASGLSAGTYVLTVTDSNNCIKTDSVVIAEPLLPVSGSTAITHVSCNGGNDGTVTVTASGGTPGYTYLWTPGGQTGSTISGQSAGTYTVTITDTNGCTSVKNAVINEPTQPAITFTGQTNVSCNGGNDGSISAVGSGGTPNFNYNWSPSGGTTSTASGLSAGTHVLTITDTKGCTAQDSVIITEPVVLTVTATPIATSCNGGGDGMVSAAGSGGTPGYSYSWLPGGQAGASISGQSAGTYTVTVTDSNGCTVTNSAVVTEPSPIVLSAGAINSACGLANGLAYVSVASGGVGPFTYLWSPVGGTNDTATGLYAGAYTVTVTDINGCSEQATGNVNDSAAAAPTIINVTNVSCNGGSDGSATVTLVGGVGPFTYLWTPSGDTSATATGLSAGIHHVTVLGSNGCISNASTPVITQPNPIVTTVSVTDVSCTGGNDGGASVTTVGGTPGYSYQWLPGGSTGTSITNLSAGMDSIVTTDTNGCVRTTVFEVEEPLAPVSVVLSTTPVSCNGGSDGSVSAVASGGSGLYSYNWMPGNYSGANISSLPIGIYTVTATDAKGCSAVDSIAVTEPTPIVLTTSSVNSTCGQANGQASVNASGGTPGYTYQWTPLGGTNSITTGLLSGSYTITVNDTNGCEEQSVVVVNNTPGPTASIASTTNVSCYGSSDGTATAAVAGGTTPYTYQWTPLGGTGITGTGLSTGTYTVVVTDSNGCTSNASTPVITQPNPIVTTVSVTDVSCTGGNDGGASVTTVGGTPGYSYQWLPGGSTGTSITNLSAGMDSIVTTDTNGCVRTTVFEVEEPLAPVSVVLSTTPVSCNGGSDGSVSAVASGGSGLYSYNWMPGNYSGANISSLPIGTYTVTATDAKGCSAVDSIAVTEPTPIILTTSSVNSTCGQANGQASVNASGGTPGYTYQWTPLGGTNSITTGLLSGSYTITVNDTNGCEEQSVVVVNNTPGPTASIASTTNVSCYGSSDGTATAAVAGGTTPYTYQWTPLGGTGITGTGLSTGTYTVVVTDSNGCVSNASTPVITQPNPIVTTVSVTDVSCTGGNDGGASVTTVGGTPGYSYQWLPGGSTGTSITNLSAGMDSIVTTDTNGCVRTTVFEIEEPLQLTASVASVIDVSCNGGANGSATITVSGGTPFYSYSWNPYGGNSATATGLSAGNYVVNVTDFNGCVTTVNVSIAEPAQTLSATSTITPGTCFGASNGTATVIASGGTPGYTYLWTPTGEVTPTITGLSPGNYSVLVVDTNGCETSVALTITQPPALTGELAVQNPSCGLANGAVSVQVSGGTPSYTYSWNPGGSTVSGISGLAPGAYSIDVTDSLGCILTLSANLIDIPGPTVSIPDFTNVSCYGENDGNATAEITGGTSPYAVNWTPFGGNDLTANFLIQGVYTVHVVDSLGCMASDSIVITEPAPVSIAVDSVIDVSCAGGSDGSVTVSVSGGTGSYTYLWSPGGGTSSTASNLIAGVYELLVSDVNGCSSSISVVVSEPLPLISSIGTVVNPTCNTSTNGSAQVIASGGTMPYAYSWNPGGQTGSVATNLSGGTYLVIITDTNGCMVIDSVTLVQPQPVVTIAGANDTICLGQSGAVSATATGGLASYSYSWQPAAVTNSGTLNITPIEDTEYTVMAFDQNGCPGNLDTVYAHVISLDASNIQASTLVSSVCLGQTTQVSVEQTGIDEPLTYTWDNGLGSGQGPFTVSPFQATDYVVTATNSCGISVSDTVSVSITPPPVLLFGSDQDSSCAPGIIMFTDSSVSSNPDDQLHYWNWSFGDGTTSQLQSPEHIYSQPGIYQVTLSVTTGNGCTNNNYSAPYTISVFPYPSADFSLNDNTFYLPTEPMVTTNNSTGGTTYEWSFGDGATSSEFEPVYLYNSIGTYQVQLIVNNEYGCSDTAITEVITSADLVVPTAFTPNTGGSSGGYYDVTSLNNDIFFPYAAGVVDYKFEIFNRWGELIFVTNEFKQGWDGYYKGELVQKGVYIWKIYARFNDDREVNRTGDVSLLR